MMGDKKKALTAMLGPESPGIGIKDEDGDMGDDGHAIANEMMDAFHAKDSAAFWDAFKAGVDHLDSQYDDQEGSE